MLVGGICSTRVPLGHIRYPMCHKSAARISGADEPEAELAKSEEPAR